MFFGHLLLPRYQSITSAKKNKERIVSISRAVAQRFYSYAASLCVCVCALHSFLSSFIDRAIGRDDSTFFFHHHVPSSTRYLYRYTLPSLLFPPFFFSFFAPIFTGERVMHICGNLSFAPNRRDARFAPFNKKKSAILSSRETVI